MSTIIRIVQLFFVLNMVVSGVFSAEIYVPDNYKTIQAAIDSASAGDTIIVRSGNYYENISFQGKAIILTSELGPEVTTIDGSQAEAVVLFINNETASSVLSGFTITNGSGSYRAAVNWYYGGGVRCHHASPIIVGNIIELNSVLRGYGGVGGGLYLDNSSAQISFNIIESNASWNGGGIAISESSASISDNIILGNYSWNGGGIYVERDSSAIKYNTIRKNYANYGGGGILCNDHSSSRNTANIIEGNDGREAGGGIACLQYSTPVIDNNVIKNNYLSHPLHGDGGGILIGFDSNALIINNTLIGNSATVGGGLVCHSNSKSVVINTIFWKNIASDRGMEICVNDHAGFPPALLNIAYSDIKGGQSGVHVDPQGTLNWGPGMVDLDPLFCDEVNGDYHIKLNSPCIDAGITHSSLPTTDFEGDTRLALNGVDIGCDEFSQHLYFAGDAFPGGKAGINVVGGPGQAVTLALGLGVQEPPVPTPYGNLFLIMPPKAAVPLGIVPSNGIMKRSWRVPMTWSPGDQYPFQALIGQQGGPQTKLSNLEVLDVVEEEIPAKEYKHDDGSCEDLYGLVNDGDMCWLQRYDAVSGQDMIVSVNQVYGSFVYPSVAPPNGHSCEVFVWDDPSNDGDPSDCVLLTRESTTVQNVNKNIMTTIPLTTPVLVTGQFYVGCVMTLPAGMGGAPADMTTVYEPGLTFFCATATPGTFNPFNLIANSLPPSDAGVFMCIRAGY